MIIMRHGDSLSSLILSYAQLYHAMNSTFALSILSDLRTIPSRLATK